jgi:hypothetical protein
VLDEVVGAVGCLQAGYIELGRLSIERASFVRLRWRKSLVKAATLLNRQSKALAHAHVSRTNNKTKT